MPAPPPDPEAALLDPIFAEREKPDTDEEKSAPPAHPLVVRLVPLSTEQRQTLAAVAGIRCEDFVKAIEQSGLDALAERPGDLLELAAYWIAHGMFGSLAEMTENAVQLKLSEFDKYRPDNSALAPAKAREGRRGWRRPLRLANPSRCGHPHRSLTRNSPGALWTHSLCLRIGRMPKSTRCCGGGYSALPPMGGYVSPSGTQEYLAAQWLHRLLVAGCPHREVWDLIFAAHYGIETVVPSLRASASWLASKDSGIRKEIIRRERMMRLQEGDPGSLPLDVKEGLLLTLAARHAAGDVANDSVDNRSYGCSRRRSSRGHPPGMDRKPAA